jgi:nitroimidazol reductase NimA-like FMN-containing flavoprotein (pyridoxamine 5'-phosphate oxidase superfamily)
MMQTEYGALELSRSECLALLPSAPFGRLVFTEGALPAVLAVNFVLTSAGVVLRTREEGAIARAAAGGAVVAFQADDIDPVARTGWSVAVTGVASPVTSAGEALRMGQLGIDPWAPGPRDTYVRIVPGMVTGRSLTALGA